MPQAPGHPATAMIEVHGGGFGNHTETTLGALLVDAFGEGVVEAIQEIATAKGAEIAKEREKAEKAEAARLAKEEKEAKEAAEKEEKHLASKAHAKAH